MPTITNGSIQLIDPIDSVSKLPSELNGTPDYEKMFIFVELSAERRGRSVIVSNSTGTNVENSAFNDLKVNLMGADINGNGAQLTTKWTDNTSDTEKVLEGFGITQIDIKVTSSFVPEVTIEFVDIRGMAFFNKGKNSPYSILFDFPPALYNLTVKGYYGKSLTYQLHLVNHSTRFDSATGNYHTTANFIARTFAPLTDIPFKMVEILPLVDQRTESNIDPNSQIPGLNVNTEEQNVDIRVRPRNTYEMIKKLESLYDHINEIKDNSEESKAITDAQKDLKLGSNLYNTLNTFRLSTTTLQNGTVKIIQKENVDFGNDKDTGRLITSLNQYNSILVASKDSNAGNDDENSNMKLYLGVKVADTQKDLIIDSLTTFKDAVLDNADDFLQIDGSEISGPLENIQLPQFNSADNTTTGYTKYICLDITKLYGKLFDYINDKNQVLKDRNTALTEKVSNTAKTKLGMQLTPYEVFKIICDDIDKFFNKLRKTNVDAETHHNDFFGEISGNGNVIDGKKKKLSKLYSFPLYVKENKTCGVTRQARAYPDDLSNSLPRPFPEIELVENFIDAFINLKRIERVEDLKTQEDAEGNNKWIPVTPLDSELSGIIDYSSPYANIELKGKEDQITNSILNVILNRFYIASQFTYGNSFYRSEKENRKIRFIAGAEAVNLANSLINNETIGFFERKAEIYKNNPDQFYSELNQLAVKNYSSIPQTDSLNLNLDEGSKSVYRTRTNSNYEGVRIINDFTNIAQVREVNDSTSSTNPVDVYIRERNGWWDKIIESIFSSEEARISRFTQQNVPFLNDVPYDKSKPSSRYLEYEVPSDMTLSPNYGSTRFKTNSLLTTWCDILSRKDNNILSFLTGSSTSEATKAFFLVSNFGFTMSYFNQKVNKIFKNPALVEVSKFSTLYMGGLKYYNDNIDNVQTQIDELYSTGFANSRPFNKQNIISDSQAVLLLSNEDIENFQNQFSLFLQNDYSVFYNSVVKMLTTVKNLVNDGDLENSRVEKHDKYLELLKTDENVILDTLNKRVGVLNYSEYTFSNTPETTSSFTPLSISNQGEQKSFNDTFFKEFFTVLSKFLPEKKQEALEQEVEFGKSLGDNDIKTQLYYTFKSISDKWISGFGNNINKGFPLNRGSNDPLINKFVFVDRAMNPIGDEVVLNVQSLLELSKDYDVNIFTVFSRILSENGFEIFPLQNFMVHSNGSWEDLFRIYETVNQPSTPLFVCMYIGGTSSTLNSVDSEYEDDGILDLGSEQLPDFKETDCDSPEVVNKRTAQTGNDEKFQYSQVKAFRVRYGEQNQSFFTDIQLDSKEYPETAESLAILSSIAGDESNASPVPKGQNLFNLYENRAYSTTVTMLGNVMIQPTQYFQLENIPMYSGAYVILDVNHKITPNHMITQFQGTRILKYPQPFVTEFSVSVGLNGTTVDGNSDVTNEATAKSNTYLGTVTDENGDVLIPQLQHNSMYNLRVS